MEIIGRKKELSELERLYSSGRPEFVVIYGRRRIGKTYLVRECFSARFAFCHTGASPADFDGSLAAFQRFQLRAFALSLQQQGLDFPKGYPASWLEAMEALKSLLSSLPSGRRLVVFLDELPWMCVHGSGFLSALEHFWNSWGASHPELMLIVCGSAASWMNDNILTNTGGLYGRVTYVMRLSPFTLGENEAFLGSRGVVMDRYDQLQCYMVFGGVPYYLNYLQPGKSLAQNIDDLFFSPNGRLRHEFELLYKSLFANYENCLAIVRFLDTRRDGYTRKEIAEGTKLSLNGALSQTLAALERSDFIRSYTLFGASKRKVYYKLVDFFSHFHLSFLEGRRSAAGFWCANLNSPKLNAWRGLAFEDVCLAHQEQLKHALGFSAVVAEAAPWRSQENEAQVDLLFDRQDRVVTLCEMKFSPGEFAIDKEYDAKLRRKVAVFQEETGCKKAVQLSLVTTYGLRKNAYSGHVHGIAGMDELFCDSLP